jgi:PKD repeat protein
VLANQITADTWTHFSWDLVANVAINNIEVDVYTNGYANGTWLIDNVQVSNVIPIFNHEEVVTSSYVQNSFTYSPSGDYAVANICVNYVTYPLTDYDISTVTATIDGSSRTVWFRDNYVYIDTSGLNTSPHNVVIQANRSVSGVAPVAAFSADVTSGTEPLTVTFTDASTNTPTSWSWTFGDGGTSTLRNPVHVYSDPGTYTVSLTVTNAAGSDTETKTGYITVYAAASAPTAAFTADYTSGTAPLTVTFTDSSTGNPTSWLWDFGDGTTSTDQNPVHTYTISGSYTVTLTVSNTAGSDSETKIGYITVAAKSVAYWFWYWFSRLWR